MWEYTTLLQFAKIILASQVLQAVGVPYANLVVYMAAAPLLAAFRLFYFGTYLPHLPPDNSTVMNWQKSHSSDDPVWLTFLKCYNFGLHWEHHRWGKVGWGGVGWGDWLCLVLAVDKGVVERYCWVQSLHV